MLFSENTWHIRYYCPCLNFANLMFRCRFICRYAKALRAWRSSHQTNVMRANSTVFRLNHFYQSYCNVVISLIIAPRYVRPRLPVARSCTKNIARFVSQMEYFALSWHLNFALIHGICIWTVLSLFVLFFGSLKRFQIWNWYHIVLDARRHVLEFNRGKRNNN